MTTANEHYFKLQGSYLFSTIAKKVAAYKEAHPDKQVISLGIGDVSQPLVPAVIEALHRACDEMGQAETFRGYGPEQGYAFLREAILQGDYLSRGINLSADEIFVSDGAKSDVANFQELFAPSAKVALQDPVYPVYLDTNVMAGRTQMYQNGRYGGIIYLPCTEETNFAPQLPAEHADIIYLCSPNNPTGTALTKAQLQRWVDYAREHHSIILYDSAYEAYITQNDIPHSIYEIDGAQEVAVEFRSFSKTAGFTGTRCAYTVVPKAVKVTAPDGSLASLNALWLRRQTTKFNGVPYIVQRAAQAVYSQQGRMQIQEVIGRYQQNARVILTALRKAGITAYGGENAPYIWLKTPKGLDSWSFFDKLLTEAQVVGTPGVGFGACGEGFFRLTAFNTAVLTEQAALRVAQLQF
ncbi:LL-diaminopimelate aminotransferase [Candidatus Avelusimicrobium luingense]|uniref:LL-diaminopimelate aminotransferase n=1 Tax=Candidatus Avelusimicrobium luingense TaxID=3416211 RepID=UPI003D106F79